MLISRTPYRISLFGGTTDYPEFYSRYGSLLIGFAINKYSYLLCRKTPKFLSYKSRFSYSQTEIIDTAADLKSYLRKIDHNGIRGVLDYFDCFDDIEISHFCDIPSQTGLGSSSTFVVGLVNAISNLCYKETKTKWNLARTGIFVERVLLKEPGGIQDQIWAAYGGLNSISIQKNGSFSVKPLPVSEEFVSDFIDRSVLIYTNGSRKSFQLANHDESSHDTKLAINDIAIAAEQAFRSEDIQKIGELLDQSWEQKKKIKSEITNSRIDELYSSLKSLGMTGGKLLGAGGSGFIYGVFPYSVKHITFPEEIKNNIVDFGIDYEGSKIIYD